MLHNYFQQKNMNHFSESLEKPVKELMDLNVKALQSLTYMTPTELFMMRRPEDVMEKNMQMLIDNSNAALTYMQNMFNIMEKHWLKNVDELLKNTPNTATHAKQASHTSATHAKDSAKKTASRTAKTVSTKAKPSTAKSKSSAVKSTSAKKHPIKHAAATMSKDTKATAKPQTVTPEVKHMSSNSPHMSSSTSHIKPMDNKK